jgi:hypothetical protein
MWYVCLNNFSRRGHHQITFRKCPKSFRETPQNFSGTVFLVQHHFCFFSGTSRETVAILSLQDDIKHKVCLPPRNDRICECLVEDPDVSVLLFGHPLSSVRRRLEMLWRPTPSHRCQGFRMSCSGLKQKASPGWCEACCPLPKHYLLVKFLGVDRNCNSD